jgi:hypothetical protein
MYTSKQKLLKYLNNQNPLISCHECNISSFPFLPICSDILCSNHAEGNHTLGIFITHRISIRGTLFCVSLSVLRACWAQSIQSARLFFPSSELGHPPESEWCSPSPLLVQGGNTPAKDRGWGTQFQRRDRHPGTLGTIIPLRCWTTSQNSPFTGGIDYPHSEPTRNVTLLLPTPFTGGNRLSAFWADAEWNSPLAQFNEECGSQRSYFVQYNPKFMSGAPRTISLLNSFKWD